MVPWAMTPTPTHSSISSTPCVSLLSPLCVVFLRFLPFKTPFLAPPSLSFQSVPDTFVLFGRGVGFFPTFGRSDDLDSSSLFSNSCGLFCRFLHQSKTQLFCFQAIPHSLCKTPGVWVPRTINSKTIRGDPRRVRRVGLLTFPQAPSQTRPAIPQQTNHL